MYRLTRAPVLLVALLLPLVACGGSSEANPVEDEESAAAEATTTADPGSETVDRPRPPARRSLAAGVEMSTTLDEALDTEHLKAGDAFTATVAEAVADGGTHVVVPKGSRVYGRVTKVRQPSGDEVGIIALALDSIQVRGTAQPLAADITSTDVETRGEMKNEAEKIGGGAAAGAIIGAIVGEDVKGAVIGAGAGAAVGTVIALGTKAHYGVLPKGTGLTLRLTEALSVPTAR